MDGIQPYSGGPPAPPHAPSGHPSTMVHGAGMPHGPHFAMGHFGHGAHPGQPPGLPPKTTVDYLRSIRRRAWLVAAIAALISVSGTLVVLRMPAVYRAVAEVTIEPPRYDPYLARIIAKDNLIQVNSDDQEKYVPSKLQMLRSRSLVDKVVRDPSLAPGGATYPGSLDDPADELIKNLYTRVLNNSNYFNVWLEGRDPAKVTRTLDLLLDEFRRRTREESEGVLHESSRQAGKSVQKIDEELNGLQAEIYEIVRNSGAIGPGGMNFPKERLHAVQQQLQNDRVRYSDLDRNVRLNAYRPAPVDPRADARLQRIGRLEEDRDNAQYRLDRSMTHTKARDDPAALALVRQIRQANAEIARLRAMPAGRGSDGGPVDESENILASARDEIRSLQSESDRLLGEMKESMPKYDRYLELVALREQKQKQRVELGQKLSEFTALAATRKDPVAITVQPREPTIPERPRRGLFIGGVIALGLMIGVATAGLLEHVDQSVKVPEHLTMALGLPLLGVVPRIRRSAKVARGGHLWTPGRPDSVEADSYRNLRASLVGVAANRGPILTLLVTSAKAGEGKSTTALNLAATCARAGERTLLVDVDLRRPSLADVFVHEDGLPGLVDVLKGETPWQRVVVPTDLPNLDFLPTGETRDVPIEILGSLELRQLVLSLSQHHYDRVILDGPAILGLADCRLLGRIVDAAVLVVRGGAHGLGPIRRAKAMLDQSHVRLAGLVFNGLADDLDNWSSYGPNPDAIVSVQAGSTAFGPGRPGVLAGMAES